MCSQYMHGYENKINLFIILNFFKSLRNFHLIWRSTEIKVREVKILVSLRICAHKHMYAETYKNTFEFISCMKCIRNICIGMIIKFIYLSY